MSGPINSVLNEREERQIETIESELQIAFADPVNCHEALCHQLWQLFSLSQQERFQAVLVRPKYRFLEMFKHYLRFDVHDRSPRTLSLLSNLTGCVLKWSLVKFNAGYLGSKELELAPLLLEYIEEPRLRINVFYYFLNCLLDSTTHNYLLSDELGFIGYLHKLFFTRTDEDSSYWAIANITGNLGDFSLQKLIDHNILSFIWQKLLVEGVDSTRWQNRYQGSAFRCLFVIMYISCYASGSRALFPDEVSRGLPYSTESYKQATNVGINYFISLSLMNERESLPAKLVCLNYFYFYRPHYFSECPSETLQNIVHLLYAFIEEILQVSTIDFSFHHQQIKQFAYGVFRLDTITATIVNLCHLPCFQYYFRRTNLLTYYLTICEDFLRNSYEHSEIVYGLRQHAGGGGKDLRSIENILRYMVIYFLQYEAQENLDEEKIRSESPLSFPIAENSNNTHHILSAIFTPQVHQLTSSEPLTPHSDPPTPNSTGEEILEYTDDGDDLDEDTVEDLEVCQNPVPIDKRLEFNTEEIPISELKEEVVKIVREIASLPQTCSRNISFLMKEYCNVLLANLS